MTGSRFWLVELHEDLEHLPITATTSPTDRFGVWQQIRACNGVKDITDMSAISFETLADMLLPSDPQQVRLWRRQKAQHLRKARHAETTASA